MTICSSPSAARNPLSWEATGNHRPFGRIGYHLPQAEFRALFGIKILGGNDDVVGKQRGTALAVFRRIVAQHHSEDPNRIAALPCPQGTDERVAFKTPRLASASGGH